jgi:hypothetical protein
MYRVKKGRTQSRTDRTTSKWGKMGAGKGPVSAALETNPRRGLSASRRLISASAFPEDTSRFKLDGLRPRLAVPTSFPRWSESGWCITTQSTTRMRTTANVQSTSSAVHHLRTQTPSLAISTSRGLSRSPWTLQRLEGLFKMKATGPK